MLGLKGPNNLPVILPNLGIYQWFTEYVNHDIASVEIYQHGNIYQTTIILKPMEMWVGSWNEKQICSCTTELVEIGPAVESSKKTDMIFVEIFGFLLFFSTSFNINDATSLCSFLWHVVFEYWVILIFLKGLIWQGWAWTFSGTFYFLLVQAETPLIWGRNESNSFQLNLKKSGGRKKIAVSDEWTDLNAELWHLYGVLCNLFELFHF